MHHGHRAAERGLDRRRDRRHPSRSVGRTTEEIVDLGIALVPEGRRLFPKLTVEENLLLGAFRRTARRELKRNLEVCFETFPRLAERRRQLAGSMSGGEQQMLALGRALMLAPRSCWSTNPRSAWRRSWSAAPSTQDCRDEERYQLTVLMAEQNFTQAIRIADRGYVIVHGKIAFEGRSTPTSSTTTILIKKFYLGTVTNSARKSVGFFIDANTAALLWRTLRRPLPFQRIPRIHHWHASHFRLGMDNTGVMVRILKAEFARELHVELALADQPPSQLAARNIALDRRANRIDRAGDRGERRSEVPGLFRRQAFRAFVRRTNDTAGFGAGDDPPQSRSNAVGKCSC
jgi:ABC-type branched-subunit amino acid transport system ATPase component